MESTYRQIEGLKIHFLKEGMKGSPVLLLHGGGIDSASLSWKFAIPALAASHQVYAVDWPGYGESDPNLGVNSIAYYVDFVNSVMDALELPAASIAGLSLGGSAALGFALKYPKRVDRLVLVDSYGLQRKVALHRLSYDMVQSDALMRWSYDLLRGSRYLTRLTLGYIMANPKSITDELVDELFQIIKSPQAGQAFLSLQRDEMTPTGLKNIMIDRVAELKMPTLLIHGQKDALVPLSCAQEALRLNPSLQLKVLPNCGHWPQRDNPDLFNSTIVEFLTDPA